MRLKSYSAPSMAEAMALVRAELGDDAIIVSTQRASGGQGVRITAALEEAAGDDAIHAALDGRIPSPVVDAIRDQLIYHGVPPRLIERLTAAAVTVETQDAVMACAGALDATLVFAGLPEKRAPRPFMLIGPPGSGKTVTVAKLAARARLANRPVAVITADSVRAGAQEQLSAFTSILGIELQKARGPESLRAVTREAAQMYDLVFIDTPGLNPFLSQDIDFLRGLIESSDVEPVLVMAAGGDPIEAAEIAEAFAEVGTTRLLATRLDMTRRLGGILAAADAGQFMISEVSITPHVANGLCPITPVSMARLLVPPLETHIDDTPLPEPQRVGAAPPADEPAPLPPDVEDDLNWAPPEPQPETRPLFGLFDEDPPIGDDDQHPDSPPGRSAKSNEASR